MFFIVLLLWIMLFGNSVKNCNMVWVVFVVKVFLVEFVVFVISVKFGFVK